MTVQPARRIAYDVIAAVRESDAYANLLLPTRIARAGLSTADAALATELTYGTLRMQGYYDRVISLAARRSVQEIDQPILDVLRLGAHQLLSMRVAQHAAVNESVELARTVGSRSATGFCNGVLRTITRSSPQQWLDRVRAAARGTAAADDELLAAEFSHPLWIVRALKQALAAEGRAAELADLLNADNVPPRVNMAALPGIATRPADAMANDYSPVGFVLEHGDPHDLMAGSNGALRVQDEGSQLVALTLSRARPIEPGERWLDLCAGPGGKAALLAAEARAGGATLVANELVPARSRLVARALAPLSGTSGHPGQAPELWIRDGRTIGDTNPGQFDRILLDAPCTGLGALRRRPEARWRKSPRDVAELVTLQAELLDSALRALKPGGILVYATCSPHLGETRVAVAGALKRGPGDVTACDTHAVLQSISAHPLDLPGDRGQAQLWPHRHGTDAMFITLLGRRQ